MNVFFFKVQNKETKNKTSTNVKHHLALMPLTFLEALCATHAWDDGAITGNYPATLSSYTFLRTLQVS